MSYSVEIPDTVFQRLQTHATPFVDTPATVIEKLLDFYDAHHPEGDYLQPMTQPIGNKNCSPDGFIRLNPETPENLKHTRVRQAKFGNFDIRNPNWNKINRRAHEIAVKTIGLPETMAITLSNVKEGMYDEDGYTFLREVNLSVQGQNSNDAWKSALNLARKLGVPVEVVFEWHNKREAAYPGRRGILSWSSN